MSYCRTTLVEFNSEKDADEAQADYSKNAASEFPEAEILLAIRTSPTSAIAVSGKTSNKNSWYQIWRGSWPA
jgi:hypothetical protein